jgi:protoheme IX farnesyltransferase
MLPVTHGVRSTQRHVLAYSVCLVAISLLPFCMSMAGHLYLMNALILGTIFIGYAAALHRTYSDLLAHAIFRYSITYLALLFTALLADHYVR